MGVNRAIVDVGISVEIARTEHQTGTLPGPSQGWGQYWSGCGPLPADAVAIGTVSRGNDVGVLLRMPAGRFMLGCNGALQSLDPRKLSAALAAAGYSRGRGGFRPGAGRRAGDGVTGTVRKTVTLDEVTISRLHAIGDNDLSLGIRRAAEIATATAAAKGQPPK